MSGAIDGVSTGHVGEGLPQDGDLKAQSSLFELQQGPEEQLWVFIVLPTAIHPHKRRHTERSALRCFSNEMSPFSIKQVQEINNKLIRLIKECVMVRHYIPSFR